MISTSDEYYLHFLTPSPDVRGLGQDYNNYPAQNLYVQPPTRASYVGGGGSYGVGGGGMGGGQAAYGSTGSGQGIYGGDTPDPKNNLMRSG